MTLDNDICPAVEYLGRPLEECPGADSEVSVLVGRPACESCVSPCFERLAELVTQNEVLTQENATLKNNLNQELAVANIDPLTGLLTRRALGKEFDKYRASGASILVAFFDIQNFSDYNSRYGHEGGDTILAAVGLAFRKHVRTSDVLARTGDLLGAKAGRHGGDEIVLIGPVRDTCKKEGATTDKTLPSNITAAGHAEGFKKRIQADFANWLEQALETIQLDKPERNRIKAKIEFHMGVVVSEIGDKRSLEELIHLADPDKSKTEVRMLPKNIPGSERIDALLLRLGRAARIARGRKK